MEKKSLLSQWTIQLMVYHCLCFIERERFESQKIYGDESEAELPEHLVDVCDFLITQYSELIAKKLLGKRTLGKILSVDEVCQYADEAVRVLNESISEDLVPSSISVDVMKIFLRTKYVFDENSKDPEYSEYDFFWKWIHTVLLLAEQRGTEPICFLSHEYVPIIIAKAMFTRDEYTDFVRKTYGLETDIQTVSKSLSESLSSIKTRIGKENAVFKNIPVTPLYQSLTEIQRRQRLYFEKRVEFIYGPK